MVKYESDPIEIIFRLFLLTTPLTPFYTWEYVMSTIIFYHVNETFYQTTREFTICDSILVIGL